MAGMFDTVWEIISKEWPVVKTAWRVFGAIEIVSVLAIWFVVNWYYGGTLSAKDAEIQLLTERLSLSQNSIAPAPPQSAGRHLTGDQKVCLTHTLEKLQKIDPTVYMFNVNDAETDKYAADFFELFHALGFNVSDGYRNVSSIDTGIVIELQDIRNPSKNALTFEDDLQSCGLDLTVEQANPVGDFDLVITDPPP